MNIRRIQYNIDYIHILTFKEEYKPAIIPYFGFDGIRYGIDNENTINETMRLIFANEHLALSIRKDGITMIYEGDQEDLKNQNGVVKFYWDIYEKIKTFQGFRKPLRHTIILNAVHLDKDLASESLKNNKYFTLNPFGELTEFAALYEYNKEDKEYKFQFGNFSEKDIKIHDLSPFKTSFNSDLSSELGIMCRLEILQKEANPTFSKFKSLLTEAERIISSYKL